MGPTPTQPSGKDSTRHGQAFGSDRPAWLRKRGMARARPSKRIIKNRKPLAERQKNCDKHNSLVEQAVRRECMRDEGFDPFEVPHAGEAIHVYHDRSASWERVGRARDGWVPGAIGSTLSINQAQRFTSDEAYWVRLECDKNAAFDVVRAQVNGPPTLVEVTAVFLALRNHADTAKGRDLVRESARAVARARGENPPSEYEVELVWAALNAFTR